MSVVLQPHVCNNSIEQKCAFFSPFPFMLDLCVLRSLHLSSISIDRPTGGVREAQAPYPQEHHGKKRREWERRGKKEEEEEEGWRKKKGNQPHPPNLQSRALSLLCWACATRTFDMQVLSMPPVFILSQDRTLHEIHSCITYSFLIRIQSGFRIVFLSKYNLNPCALDY
jgi:hypothetical protein